MANITKYVGWVALIIAVLVAYKVYTPVSFSHTFGGVGNLKIEQYDPYVLYNGGINSGLPITTSGTLTSGALSAAAATFSGNVTVTTSNTATSTITVGCFQSYATSTATALALRFTASTTAPTNGSGVIPVVSYGTCP